MSRNPRRRPRRSKMDRADRRFVETHRERDRHREMVLEVEREHTEALEANGGGACD